MISSGINLVMTVIGFAASTMFIVFVCTRLICARIQHSSASRRRAFPSAPRTYHFGIQLERRMNGLESVVVANFPTKKIGDNFSFEEETQCAICLAEYQQNDILRMLPYCEHAFHITCIDVWLRQHSTCPVCRISLRGSPDRKPIAILENSQPVGSPHPPRLLSPYSYHQHLCHDHDHSSRTTANQGIEPTHEDGPEASENRETTLSSSNEGRSDPL